MIPIKTPEEIKIMQEGGQELAQVKKELRKTIAPGISFEEIEQLAQSKILSFWGKPSFEMVPGYRWATCINVNEGVVHGIPRGGEVFAGDIVSVDVGFFYQGFHTDCAFTVGVGKVNEEKKRFLEAGKETLEVAIKTLRPGNRVGHISKAIERNLGKYGFTPIRDLTGHGIGRKLHEEPPIPCFLAGSISQTAKLVPGMVLAIEVIYAAGKPDLVLSDDDWTISTKDGKIAGLFEETVALTANGPRILTRL